MFLMSAIMGLPNELEPSLNTISIPFLKHYLCWSESIQRWTDNRFGFVDCEAWHLWHGTRKKRKYIERFERLTNFNPDDDIVSTGQFGLHEWSEGANLKKMEMINSVQEYFNAREEDEWFDSKQVNLP